MKVVIDTNSLLSLVRYYLPFDKNAVLFTFIKGKISTGEIIILDKILGECEYLSKGIILRSLPYLTEATFLKSSKLPVKTEFILAPAPEKFLRQVDNQFVNRVMKSRLTDVEYENRKTDYLNSADMKLILYCLNRMNDFPLDEVILITEETEGSNDSKLFKKIPAICKELNIHTLTLPRLLLEKYDGIDLEFN
jgi:hypothetical protein